VVAGELRVALQDEDPVLLCAGECVLFPRNDLHVMGSDLALRATSIREILTGCQGAGPRHIRHGGGGSVTRLICGYLGCAGAGGNRVFVSLPPLVRISASDGGSTDWFRAMFEYASSELAVGQPGSDTVLAKLSEVLFVEAVRRYMEKLPAGGTGWLARLPHQPLPPPP